MIFIDSVIKLPVMNLPVRTVVCDVAGGRVIFSPGSKIPVGDYKKLQGVTDLVAPNLFHMSGVPKADSVFSNARKWAPPGAKLKRPDIAWSHTLGEDTWPYQNEISMHKIAGMPKVNEYVFIHKPTSTLIVADLIFNMLDVRGFGAWLILNLFGTYKRAGISRFYVKMASDRVAFEKSVRELLTHSFERIVVAHGTIIEHNGAKILEQSLEQRLK